MEVGRGPVVRLLVMEGVLKPSHFLVAGTTYGKIRTLQDFIGKTLREAGPSTPVTVTGFKELPQFGDNFSIVKNEKEARQKVAAAKIESAKNAASTNITGADLLKMMTQKHESQDLKVIVKADVQGLLASVVNSLKIIDTQGEISLKIIGSGVGNVSENDVRLAADEQTIIYGFNVDVSPAVKRIAARDHVQVRIFNVIYKLLDDARETMESLLAPEVVEVEIGKLEIKGVFRTQKEEIIAGGEVINGKAVAGVLARIKRGNEIIAEVELVGVKRQQQQAKEVFEGEMCGVSLKTSKKIQLEEGDILELFTRELVKRTLK